jgi:hypothetical protein
MPYTSAAAMVGRDTRELDGIWSSKLLLFSDAVSRNLSTERTPRSRPQEQSSPSWLGLHPFIKGALL